MADLKSVFQKIRDAAEDLVSLDVVTLTGEVDIQGTNNEVDLKKLYKTIQANAISKSNVSLCRFCRILGTLLHNGIPIIQALEIAKASAGNQILADAIHDAAENVRHGEALTQPLAQSKLFPPAVIDMVAVAEESNTLDKTLVEIANTQEARTGRQIDLFMRLLEPLMLLVAGVMVFVVAAALLLPILTMATSGGM